MQFEVIHRKNWFYYQYLIQKHNAWKHTDTHIHKHTYTHTIKHLHTIYTINKQLKTKHNLKWVTGVSSQHYTILFNMKTGENKTYETLKGSAGAVSHILQTQYTTWLNWHPFHWNTTGIYTSHKEHRRRTLDKGHLQDRRKCVSYTRTEKHIADNYICQHMSRNMNAKYTNYTHKYTHYTRTR